ncbi:MAG: hypothetical protein LBJ00_17170 [Planctomycetaceae bacterium]|nr:hypothetical protein [Planctomycetaceae bacterium]
MNRLFRGEAYRPYRLRYTKTSPITFTNRSRFKKFPLREFSQTSFSPNI